ncbi:MAG: undecaprenyldiphospho-muramoylpentapeptide beta-N-acetylglucosaminyltransferase [Deltaproteobacteria bacterium]|nr:undecaprenyldiphospho-muramoylpentapeptide beta-N-acetylglucosaminyltransferase [Deltaproteobacteria bacterium]
MATEQSNHNARVIIAAGGTGGHLYPGIALAEEFRRTHQARVSFITTPRQVTLDILGQYDFPWQVLKTRPLKGTGVGQRLLSLCRLPFSYWQARGVLRRERPRLVVSMGGYVAGPVGLAAHRLGIPLVLHEQNAILGTTNRLLGRVADQLFLSFPESAGNPAPHRSVWSGNPIRPEFCQPLNQARAASPFTLLVMGGSQGAHHLNMQMLEALPLLAAHKENLHIIHLTGSADESVVREAYRQARVSAEVMAFSPEVRNFMHRAHLVLCRAGASTLAELTALGRVGILVPYPYAVNQHQEKNARYLSSAGAALLVLNEELTGQKIAEMIEKLISCPEELQHLEERSCSLGRPQAAALIASKCKEYLCRS